MKQSPKLLKYRTIREATYVISAHGTMITSILGTPPTKKYFAITIPKNVELYTYANLGECIPAYRGAADFVCNIYPDKYETTLRKSIVSAFRFSHEVGEANKFPELFLTPDSNTPAHFYTGIIHCIPEIYRISDSRKKEIIYNIDAKNTKNCDCSSIVLIKDSDSYDCNTKYSEDYIKQLTDYKYDIDLPITSINKCGPILMSEAVKVIKAHCDAYYEPNCLIKIYVSVCLVETGLHTLVGVPTSIALNASDKTSLKQAKQELEIEEKIKDELKKLKKKNITDKDKEYINKLEYHYEVFKHNTIEKVDYENVVKSLIDFHDTPLITPLISKYIWMVLSKQFQINTYKDAYKNFTSNFHAEFRGLHKENKEIIEQLENKYRTRDINKLEMYLRTAIERILSEKIQSDDSDNDINSLPEINIINLVSPFLTKASGEEITDAIYNQLKGLITFEKAKIAKSTSTALGLHKTLRKKGKKGKKDKKPKSQKARKTKKNNTLRT
jgi:hypothetical protein